MPVKAFWVNVLFAQHVVQHEASLREHGTTAFTIGGRYTDGIPFPVKDTEMRGGSGCARLWFSARAEPSLVKSF